MALESHQYVEQQRALKCSTKDDVIEKLPEQNLHFLDRLHLEGLLQSL